MILEFDIASVFGSGGLVACVELENGNVENVVLDATGKGRKEFSVRPVRVRLDLAPDRADGDPRDAAPDAKVVTVTEAFETGLPIDGERIEWLLSWDGRCHGEHHPVERKDGRGRFASWEHIKTAEQVGLDADGQPLTEPDRIDHQSPLPIGDIDVTFGDIICLAGDFYAHFDAETAEAFDSAWPTIGGFNGFIAGDYRHPALCEDEGNEIKKLLATIHKEGGEKSAILKAFENVRAKLMRDHPTRRYLALASQNYCHFGSEALALYRNYHRLALERARAVRELPVASEDDRRDRRDAWLGVISLEAFGCHFLTDLFATGHMRTPRRPLGERFGVLRGSLRMSAGMHDEDNERGLWCTTRGKTPGRRIVWRAYGDGRLLAHDATHHLAMVREAVRRSVAELYAAYAGVETAEVETAEAIIPVPLPPGTVPGPDDRLPFGGAAPVAQTPNHHPRFTLLPNGHIGQRIGESHQYRDLEDASTPRWDWVDAVGGFA